MDNKFERFSKSKFSLEIWSQDILIFKSKKDGVKGLQDFIGKYGKRFKKLVIFDKIVGNAAALLCVYIGAKEVYGVLGSESAEKTLRKFKIQYYFQKTIPNILNKTGDGLCPLEKLSLLKSPADLYKCLKGR